MIRAGTVDAVVRFAVQTHTPNLLLSRLACCADIQDNSADMLFGPWAVAVAAAVAVEAAVGLAESSTAHLQT